jgi:hypothetical protein
MSALARVEKFGNTEVVFYPQVQVRSNSLIIFDVSDPPPRRGDTSNLKGKATYSGTVTTHTAKRIRSALDILLQRSPNRRILNPVSNTEHDFRISFATLTVSDPKNLTAREAYDRLLARYLRYLKEKAGMVDYLWKAELQQRGQIHYHLITNIFVDYRTCRWKWNQLQKREGLLQDYARRHGNFNPNSTDIHSVQSVRNIEAYISKYICKNTQNQTATKGKVWDCSTALKAKRFYTDLDSSTLANIEARVARGEAQKISLENCTVISMPAPYLALSKAIFKSYAAWKK